MNKQLTITAGAALIGMALTWTFTTGPLGQQKMETKVEEMEKRLDRRERDVNGRLQSIEDKLDRMLRWARTRTQ